MAVISVPRVGAGEAQVFNVAPFVNYYLREQQQKKLEQQAINKQVSDDLAKYSTEGLRQQDVPKFLNEYQNLKNLSIQYRDAIRNPAQNPKAWSEYQDAKNRLTGLIAESKAAKENTKSLYDFRAHNLDKLDDDAFKQAMGLYNAPVGSPEHEQTKTFDQSQLIFKAPKMDVAKLYAPLSQLKPQENQTAEQLPNGQIRKTRTKQVDPGAIAQYMAAAYDSDMLNSKKGFNDLFSNTTPEQTAQLEEYAKQYYDPNFQIKTPKDLAIASGLFGRVNPSSLNDIGGTDQSRREAFARAQQARSFAHQDAMAEKSATRKEKDDYLWENDIAGALKSGDVENVRRLSTRLETSTPGVEKVFLKEGATKQSALNVFKKDLKTYGVDGTTKFLKPEDYKAGVLVVAVPKYGKDANGNEIQTKNKAGRPEYEYLAVSARDPYLQSRLNKLKSYAQGGTMKPLSDKIFKQQAPTALPTFSPDEFSPDNEEEQ